MHAFVCEAAKCEAAKYLRCRGPGGDVSIGASEPLRHMMVKSRQVAGESQVTSKGRKVGRCAEFCVGCWVLVSTGSATSWTRV